MTYIDKDEYSLNYTQETKVNSVSDKKESKVYKQDNNIYLDANKLENINNNEDVINGKYKISNNQLLRLYPNIYIYNPYQLLIDK